jgi:tripartite-type tricarboxylate transporter receptor subunit TctC
MRTLTLAAITLAPVVAASIALPAQAQQDYPSRTVTVVNPTQAGATTDVLARALVVGLSSRLGQQFVVVNRGTVAGQNLRVSASLPRSGIRRSPISRPSRSKASMSPR